MRIVAGAAKGRRLAPPPEGTRPTSDQVREAMFNTLAASMSMDCARVLDLFAGTGAVGLEALSRGAAQAVFVEKGRAALAVLRRNIETVALPGATVIARPVAQYLADEAPEPFDLVFLDPPYALDRDKIGEVVARLGAGGWLAEEARLVMERSAHSERLVAAETFVTPDFEKRYGDTVLWYGRRR
ncbi:16S rRNA (guanine(966)-N(2))-methyltransferase RsmD [uncultured Jatrophihabitans sp.]|uniref:16S rRNA (guanine(966)-N(2))-methyltransferase RsmD n=1 Tax=uncultured Jatrophihabitans sp. TaxID=1610747 RepID=UPI0035CBF63E